MAVPADAAGPAAAAGGAAAGSSLEAAARRRDRATRWWLAAPALAIVGLAAAGPLLVMLAYSFMERGDYGDVRLFEWSIRGWFEVFLERDIFDDALGLADAHVTILWRSVKLSLATTLITLVLGFPTAWFVATRPARTRDAWLLLVTIPFWTNLLIRTFAVQELIRNQGVVNGALIGLGVIERPIQMMFTDGAILFGMAYVYLPLMVLPLYASIERFDFRLLEAAHDLYATRWAALRRVVLPLVKPGVVAGCILVFIPSLGAYVTPRVLGGGKNLMLGNLIELQFGPGRNWPLGAALSITLLALVMLALLVYARASRAGDRARG